MRIGIDIDGVLTNDDDYILDCVSKFCYENGIDFFENPLLYEYRKLNLDFYYNELNKYLDEYFWNYVSAEPPRKFASEVIKKLKEEGHKIYIITSRRYSKEVGDISDKMRNMIRNWLKKYDISYDEIYFSPDKTEQIRKLDIDVMIEDSPITIPVFTKLTKVLCYDCRYNRDLNCENMIRVFSWYDILKQIEKMSKDL